MPTLPVLESSLLVRTDFTSDNAWQRVCDAARKENEDGFRAYVTPVSDAEFDHLSWQDVRSTTPPTAALAGAVVFRWLRYSRGRPR